VRAGCCSESLACGRGALVPFPQLAEHFASQLDYTKATPTARIPVAVEVAYSRFMNSRSCQLSGRAQTDERTLFVL
jgi:hypothetical protein